MSRSRFRAAVAGSLIAAVVAVPVAHAAEDAPAVLVSVDRERIATDLGGRFTFRSTITNASATTAHGLIAHLNVLSLRDGVYVDPEDWSSQRTRYLEPLPAGESITRTWEMQAVNDGVFGIYVAVLPESGIALPPVTGPTIKLDVATRQKLNAGGMLPVALVVPALLGLLALGVRVRRSGSSRSS